MGAAPTIAFAELTCKAEVDSGSHSLKTLSELVPQGRLKVFEDGVAAYFPPSLRA
jgi:hypothetical protein